MKMYIPLLLVVFSNTIYHTCAKSVPGKVNAFAALSITYLVGTVASLLLYFVTQKGGNILMEYKQINWASYALGIAIVGLEAGYLWMYQSGWNIGTAQIVQSSLLAGLLLIVGYFVFKETITVTKAVGVVICLVGLYLINK